MDFKASFVASLLLLYFVGQVYSTACYTCEHSPKKNNSDCKDSPKQIKYIKDCTGTSALMIDDSVFKCATVAARNKTTFIFERFCTPHYMTCALLKTWDKFKLTDGELEKCRICNGDLCNSSRRLGIAIFTLIPCFIAYFIFK